MDRPRPAWWIIPFAPMLMVVWVIGEGIKQYRDAVSRFAAHPRTRKFQWGTVVQRVQLDLRWQDVGEPVLEQMAHGGALVGDR
jgi:hypothetical protein